MSIKLNDSNAESKAIVKQVYQTLLQSKNRLVDVVDDDDSYKLGNAI